MLETISTLVLLSSFIALAISAINLFRNLKSKKNNLSLVKKCYYTLFDDNSITTYNIENFQKELSSILNSHVLSINFYGIKCSSELMVYINMEKPYVTPILNDSFSENDSLQNLFKSKIYLENNEPFTKLLAHKENKFYFKKSDKLNIKSLLVFPIRFNDNKKLVGYLRFEFPYIIEEDTAKYEKIIEACFTTSEMVVRYVSIIHFNRKLKKNKMKININVN